MEMIGTVADKGEAMSKKGKSYEWLIMAENKQRFMSFNGSITTSGAQIGSKVAITGWEKNKDFIDTIKVVPTETQANLKDVGDAAPAVGGGTDKRIYYAALLKDASDIVGNFMAATSNKRDSWILTNDELEQISQNVVNIADKLMDKTSWVFE